MSKTLAPAIVAAALLAVASHATVARAANFSTVYSFTNGADGADPVGGVIADKAGTLYGETYYGGATQCSVGGARGCGTVYSFSPTAGLKILASFTGTNGAHGGAGLTLVGSTLYGSTSAGGVGNDGVLFSVSTSGSGFTLLHQFTGSDGKNPTGFLRMGPGKVLYGVTGAGGRGYPGKSNGVLFQLAPDGTYTVLHAFTGGTDGASPDSLLISGNGVIIGSTELGADKTVNCPSGCGGVFEYAPSTAAFTVLHNFSGAGLDGATPFVGSVGPGPTVYGTAGNVFSISQDGGFSVVANFNNYVDGYGYYSGPAYQAAGTLYGVTDEGPDSGAGALYSVQNGVVTTPYLFSGYGDGANPQAEPAITPAGAVVGTTTGEGNCLSCGTIWEYTP